MRDIVTLAIVFGLLPVILVRPYVGVLAWCWIGYMNPHRLAYGLAYDFPVAAIIGGATLVGLVFTQEQKRIPWTPLTVCWVLFVLWMSFTTLFALAPDAAFEAWTKSMKIQSMTFVTVMLMCTRERITLLTATIAGSLAFYGLKGGIFALLTGGDYKVWGPPGSFIEDNNALALALVMIIPLLRYLQLNVENRLIKLGLWVTMGLSILAIVASYSRGAFIAATAMILYMIVKSSKRGQIVFVILLSLPLLFNFIPEKWFDRMSTIGQFEQDASAMGRINAWWFAYNLATDRPVTGGGFDTFNPELFHRYAPDPEDFHGAHSIYFEVLGEHGFVGLFLFLLLAVFALRTSTWIVRHARDRADMKWASDLAALVQVSVVGFAVGGVFLGLAYFDLYYHLIAILVLLRAVVERQLASTPESALVTPADVAVGQRQAS
jgi:probable O-glycosylation ligase (exosortase A-associated)